MANFHLQIVTPDAIMYDGQAESLICRTVNGDVCILAGHIDYAAALGYGEAKVKDDKGNERTAACIHGLLSVSGGNVRVMATTFEWSDEIDVARAQRAGEAAEARLKQLKTDDKDYKLAEAKLKRALVRIRAGQR
ncbi:MAG: ATP synthase F1 subunit epsilon [Clostridia bacterium]|nr:ATP synthase F1 subunit epsilon [Clostridia bacterium]